MTMRDLFNVATEHGMTVKLRPGDLKLCAIVCPDCQFGAELFDQSMEGYKREPYSCPVCTIQPQQQKEGLPDAEHKRRNTAIARIRAGKRRAAA